MSVKLKRHGRGSTESLDAKVLAKLERKAKKPIMEKKRRKRINDSLNELKNILLEIMKKDPNQTAKLEKADILEFTVQYLRNSLAVTKSSNPHKSYANFQTMPGSSLFLAGWRLCLTEVTSLLRTLNFPSEIENFVVEKLNVQLFRHQLDHHRTAAFFDGRTMAINVNSKTSAAAKKDTSRGIRMQRMERNKSDDGLWRPW